MVREESFFKGKLTKKEGNRMSVKGRKRIVRNPETVHEVLPRVLAPENEVDRMKEHSRGQEEEPVRNDFVFLLQRLFATASTM